MTTPRSGLVAVLFTDLVGSTELMSQLGDRAFDDLRRRHFAALSKAISAHGGEEVKNTGDGLMAVLGPLVLKGLPEPVAVCDVGWELAEPTVPMPALLTEVGRIFVGRNAEPERLGQLWKEAAAGERRVSLPGGEPGVGKTRLAAELAASVHQEGAIVLAGRCDEDLCVPFQPFAEALQHYAAHVGEPRLGRYGGELTRLVPELAAKVPGLSEPDDRFREAEGVHERFGAAPWTARTRLEWARMLLTRRQPGDPDSARALLGSALSTARELGLANVERRAVELLR